MISLLVCLLVVSVFTGDPYKKVIHNIDPEAKCLDGSPGLLYLHEGGDTSKILIYFIGGGLCGQPTLGATLESCYERSKTILGSSKFWPQEIIAEGMLSTNPSNPYASWTKVAIGYCDGSLHQGYSSHTVKYRDAQLYFRGATLARSHFKWIQEKYDLTKAEKIILTGSSAGGVAAYLWSNYLCSIVPNCSRVSTIIDSGVLVQLPTYQTQQQWISNSIQSLYSLSNYDQQTPIQQCNAKFKGKQWKCLFFQNSWIYIQARMLTINSQYDAWLIPNILRIKCLKTSSHGKTLEDCTDDDLTGIEQARSNFSALYDKYLSFSKNNVWAISCSNHVYTVYENFYDSADQKVPENTGQTVADAVNEFMEGRRVQSLDKDPWPANKPCAF